MERFPKVKFIVITILVITLVNVVALGFILKHSFQEHRRSDGDKKEFKGFDFLKYKLQLTPQQEVLFKNEKDSFFVSANLIFDELEERRLEMIREMSKPKPDTLILYSIADNMGVNHGELKRRVVDHFLKLRSYCTPEQVVKLDSMYNFMIRTDSPWRKKRPEDGRNIEKNDQNKK